MTAKYQLLPRLTDELYKKLEDDIVKRGVMVPIEFDDEGEILDGHHRKETADKHGLDYPRPFGSS